MRVIRYMLLGRFWTTKEYLPLCGSMFVFGGSVVCLSWLSERFHAPDWAAATILVLGGAAWVGFVIRLAIHRIRDIRAEEAAGRYMP